MNTFFIIATLALISLLIIFIRSSVKLITLQKKMRQKMPVKETIFFVLMSVLMVIQIFLVSSFIVLEETETVYEDYTITERTNEGLEIQLSDTTIVLDSDRSGFSEVNCECVDCEIIRVQKESLTGFASSDYFKAKCEESEQ